MEFDNYYVDKIKEWNKRFNIKAEYTPLRKALIIEELNELQDASSMLDTLDALCDVVYVVAGTQVAAGIYASSPFEWEKCDIETLDLENLIFEVEDEQLDTNHGAVLLADLISYCETVASYNGFDLRRNFDIVHTNNMQKIWTDEQKDSLPADCSYIITTDWPNSPGWIVKSPAGKVIKPPGHPRPELVL